MDRVVNNISVGIATTIFPELKMTYLRLLTVAYLCFIVRGFHQFIINCITVPSRLELNISIAMTIPREYTCICIISIIKVTIYQQSSCVRRFKTDW